MERAKAYWGALGQNQKVVMALSALAGILMWEVTGDGVGNVLWLSILATFVGATQLHKSTRTARLTVLFGAAITGLILVWAIEEYGGDDLRPWIVLAISVVSAVLVSRPVDPVAEADLAAISGAGLETPEGPQVGSNVELDAYPVSRPEPGAVQADDAGFQPTDSPSLAVAPEEVEGGAGDISAHMPLASDLLASHLELSDSGVDKSSASETVAEPTEQELEIVRVIAERDEEERRSKIRRAGIVSVAVLILAVAGWAGAGTYERSEAAEARVGALSRAVEAFSGPDIDAALQAGQAAVEAKGDGADLTEVFGAQGSSHALRLAAAYMAYKNASEGETHRAVVRQRSELSRIQSQASSARSGLDDLERRTFAVGRQFDTVASGARMYEAADMTSYQRVVLKVTDDIVNLEPGRQAVLYVDNQGQEPVTVTVSNAYRSYDKTEYFTVFRVEGPAAQVDGLIREVDAGLAAAQASMAQTESIYQESLALAREDYWTAAQPEIESLRAAK